MGSDTQSIHAVRRMLSFSLLKPEQWDRHKHLRGALILAMTISSLVAGIGWYQFVTGVQILVFRVVILTMLAVVILVVVPKKWELITLSIGLTFILSIIGTLLRRAPLGFGLELVFVTGVLYFGCVYVGQRLKEHKGK